MEPGPHVRRREAPPRLGLTRAGRVNDHDSRPRTAGTAGDVTAAYRLPLLMLAFVALSMGIGAGLVRLGWAFPLPSPTLVAMHGPLMVSGFFGTVIALERAVALARRWAYLGPLAAGLGAVALVAGTPAWVGQGLLVAGSAVLAAASIAIFLRQRALFTLTLAAGAGFWLTGNLLWLGGMPVQAVVPSWAGFLIVTIAGERLELSRFLRPSRGATRTFAVILAALAGGIAMSVAYPQAGSLALGAALVALALWLARQDIARRTVRDKGLTRFIAVCLLAGYAWLALGGAVILAAGGLGPGSRSYDAALHALMLGFVFSMVFGHAPVIIPAVARVAVPYHPTFYVPLALLHLSLAVRVAGDATDRYVWRSTGGLLDAIALLAFLASTIAAVARGRWFSRRPVRG